MSAELWTESFLAEMREVADPEADAVIAEVLGHGGKGTPAGLDRFLLDWEAPATPETPPAIRAFLDAPVAYPDWVDRRQLEQASRLFAQWGIETLLVLFTKALAQFFADANSAVVFSRNNVFDPAGIRRFLTEIAQLTLEIMRPNGLSLEPEKSVGVLALQKLRLHHSMVRYYSLHDPRMPPWDPAWGQPINQEDLAGALCAFTLWDLEGLKKLGADLKPDEQAATLMAWRVICFWLGLDERLQPADLAEARLLLDKIAVRQFHASPWGTSLVRQLLDVMQGFLPRPLRSLPVVLMRYLMDPPFIRMLQVPRPGPFAALLLALFRLVLADLVVLQRVVYWLGRAFVKWMAATRRPGRRPLEVPPRYGLS